MSWEKLPVLPGRPNPCLCCPPIPSKACLTKIVAVGFGGAMATRDDECVADGENGLLFVHGDSLECREPIHTEEFLTFDDIEAIALKDPDHDWRIRLDGPLHGETYQRQGDGEWMLVEKNDGFA
jgi:hypothetical protein